MPLDALSSQLARFTGLRRRHELDAELASILHDVLQPDCVGVFRPVGEFDDLRWSTCAWRGAAPQSPPAATGDAGTVALPVLEAYPLRRQALAGKAQCRHEAAGQLRVLPLHSANEVIGVVECRTARPVREPSLAALDDVLRVYRNVHGLLDYSERDTLTGLLNRKTFDQSLFEPHARADNTPLGYELRAAPRTHNVWVGVIDVDHFKSVNDRFGHLIGDEVLILLSRLMRASFRRSDGLYRFGGEEFVALVHNVTAREARAVFERFRCATEACAFPQVGRLTVSVGYAEARPGESPSDAVGRADEAVYHAKSNGRNQTHDHAALIAGGALGARANVGEVELF